MDESGAMTQAPSLEGTRAVGEVPMVLSQLLIQALAVNPQRAEGTHRTRAVQAMGWAMLPWMAPLVLPSSMARVALLLMLATPAIRASHDAGARRNEEVRGGPWILPPWREEDPTSEKGAPGPMAVHRVDPASARAEEAEALGRHAARLQVERACRVAGAEGGEALLNHLQAHLQRERMLPDAERPGTCLESLSRAGILPPDASQALGIGQERRQRYVEGFSGVLVRDGEGLSEAERMLRQCFFRAVCGDDVAAVRGFTREDPDLEPAPELEQVWPETGSSVLQEPAMGDLVAVAADIEVRHRGAVALRDFTTFQQWVDMAEAFQEVDAFMEGPMEAEAEPHPSRTGTCMQPPATDAASPQGWWERWRHLQVTGHLAWECGQWDEALAIQQEAHALLDQAQASGDLSPETHARLRHATEHLTTGGWTRMAHGQLQEVMEARLAKLRAGLPDGVQGTPCFYLGGGDCVPVLQYTRGMARRIACLLEDTLWDGLLEEVLSQGAHPLHAIALALEGARGEGVGFPEPFRTKVMALRGFVPVLTALQNGQDAWRGACLHLGTQRVYPKPTTPPQQREGF